MVDRLRMHLILTFAFASVAAIGLASSLVVPHPAAESLEEAIRDAKSPDELRERIVEYHESTTVSRLLLIFVPSLAAGIMFTLALYDLLKGSDTAGTGRQHHKAVQPPHDGCDAGSAES